jgi:hypothetical protein
MQVELVTLTKKHFSRLRWMPGLPQLLWAKSQIAKIYKSLNGYVKKAIVQSPFVNGIGLFGVFFNIL